MIEQDLLKRATETARQTSKLLKKRGWCFWRCDALDGEIITVMRNDFRPTEQQEMNLMEQLAEIYVREPDKTKVNQEWLGSVYTETELKILASANAMQFVHEAKKIAGATLTPAEE